MAANITHNIILIVGGSGSGKTTELLNLINSEPDIDKVFLHTKDPHYWKYQYPTKNR